MDPFLFPISCSGVFTGKFLNIPEKETFLLPDSLDITRIDREVQTSVIEQGEVFPLICRTHKMPSRD